MMARPTHRLTSPPVLGHQSGSCAARIAGGLRHSMPALPRQAASYLPLSMQTIFGLTKSLRSRARPLHRTYPLRPSSARLYNLATWTAVLPSQRDQAEIQALRRRKQDFDADPAG